MESQTSRGGCSLPADRTSDGVEITVGLRVFTTDWEWGTVTKLARHTESNGGRWHRVRLDDGSINIYDGSRLTTQQPR